MTGLSSRSDDYPLRRRAVVAEILRDRGDLLVVSGLGAPSWDVTAAGDSPLTFPLWGGMGGAVMAGLGLALARPERRVLVVTGDGEMLMGVGSLATVAVQQPANLTVVVLDNERYGETGMQATHTAGPADLAATAKAMGIARTETIRDETALAAALQAIRDGAGPALFVVKLRAETLPLALPPRDGVVLKDRFRAALLDSDPA